MGNENNMGVEELLAAYATGERDFSEADLDCGASLNGANLEGATLSEANFSGANLSGANRMGSALLTAKI